MSLTKTRLEQFLSGPSKEDKRQLTMTLPAATVDQLDRVAAALSQEAGRPCTRQQLISLGIEAVLADAQELLAQHDLFRPAPRAAVRRRQERQQQERRQPEYLPLDHIPAVYDTVVLPANEEGFVRVFLCEHCWRYARLRADRVPALRYLALYVTKPHCHISHYAPISWCEPVRDPGTGTKKYLIHFEEAPVVLDRPVPLGDLNPAATRSPKYTTLKKLRAAATYADL